MDFRNAKTLEMYAIDTREGTDKCSPVPFAVKLLRPLNWQAEVLWEP